MSVRSPSPKAALAAFAILAGALTTRRAHAEPTADAAVSPPPVTEKARKRSNEGLEYFKQGEYDLAIDAFRASYALSPLPVLLFDMAQAFRKKGECARALSLYRRYLNDEPLPTNREQVEQFITEMSRCAEPDGATSGPPVVAEAEPPAASAVAAAPTNTTTPAPSQGPPSSDTGAHTSSGTNANSGAPLRTAGVVVGAVGVVALGVGVYSSIQAARASQKISDLFAKGGQWTADDDTTLSHGDHFRTAAVISYVASGVSLGTGAVLYYLGVREGRSALSGVAVQTQAGGGRVIWTAAF